MKYNLRACSRVGCLFVCYRFYSSSRTVVLVLVSVHLWTSNFVSVVVSVMLI